MNTKPVFDADRFEGAVRDFVQLGSLSDPNGDTTYVLAEEAAKFFGMPQKVMLTILGANVRERWRSFYLAGKWHTGNKISASSFGAYLTENW